MKLQRLTLVASLFLTVAMSIVALAFDYTKDKVSADQMNVYLTVFWCIILIFGLNYIILDYLFNFYGRKQIRKISTIFPQEFLQEDDSTLNFQELGERVSQLKQKNATELDTMKEMEIYRKEYLGNVSHEMKTPLFTIQGYVETLIDGGVENLAIRDKYLQRIGQSAQRLLAIVQDLDMINQYESGEISLNITKFDLNILVKEIADLLDLEAQRKESKVVLKTSTPHIFVNADKHKISQVLINLISNAIYYANREKAQITVRTEIVNSKVLVEVADNGMGIRPEFLPRIFERFFRVESSRNRKDGGSGLGLAIVKHILEAHGETIAVKSVYLEGTQFQFLLKKSN